jgi:hypothetical protein
MKTRTRKGAALGLILLVPWLGAGCGGDPKLAQVEGRVLLDGKPLNNILVTFLPDTEANTFGPNSAAVTDEDGHYQLVCEDGARRPGAVIGVHRVTLLDLDAISLPSRGQLPAGMRPKALEKGNPSNAKGRLKRRLPAGYMDLAKTPLKRQVEPGSQVIDLEVTAGSRGRGR